MALSAPLRWPIEIISFGLALWPLLSVALVWSSLPTRIPVHFAAAGHADRWRPRAQAWILPLMALIVYGCMSQSSGTWAWAFYGEPGLPSGAEYPLLLKPVIALLMIYVNSMLIRQARRQSVLLNGWLLTGLMTLLLTPPLAISFVTF